MKKIIVICCIVALFFVPILLRSKQSEQEPSESEPCEPVVFVDGTSIPLESYVLGVIAAEMPASYELEALKAQAIASRTYALYNKDTELTSTVKHQVFHTQSQRAEKWQDDYTTYEEKLSRAVNETAGQVITYNDDLISAMFHAASNGQTESALNFSGHDIPYLQSVSSPEVDEVSQPLAVSWSKQDIEQMKLVRNSTGRVESVTVAATTLTGRELREQLSLRSTDFQFTIKDGKVVVTTFGYGHGVGMSQQGANEYAKKGWLAPEILTHYYTNTKIESYSCKKID